MQPLEGHATPASLSHMLSIPISLSHLSCCSLREKCWPKTSRDPGPQRWSFYSIISLPKLFRILPESDSDLFAAMVNSNPSFSIPLLSSFFVDFVKFLCVLFFGVRKIIVGVEKRPIYAHITEALQKLPMPARRGLHDRSTSLAQKTCRFFFGCLFADFKKN